MQRTLALRLKHKILSFRYKHLKPTWSIFPRSVQLNTHNYCNLNCVYCNVKEGGSYKQPRGVMPTQVFYDLLSKLWPHRQYVETLATFMNGEPLLEKRLTEFNDELLRHPYSNVLDTNGTLPDRVDMLLHPAVKTIRVSLSAADPENYVKIHGADYFPEVCETLEYLDKHKHKHQRLSINHMVCRVDEETDTQVEHRTKQFLQKFRDYHVTVFPLHTSPEQTSTHSHLTDVVQKPQKWYKGRYLGSNWDTMRKPCQCYDLLGIGKHGEIMHCVDYPETYNYGSFYDVDIAEAWRLRLNVGLGHKLCRDCSLNLSKS